MRFDGKRQVPASREALWQALHDPQVLRDIVTGCESMRHLDGGTYAATMVARVGPMTDTYRGTFTIDDLRASMVGIEYRDSAAFIDEIPAAYKDIDQVMADASNLVEIRHPLHQLVNVKGD